MPSKPTNDPEIRNTSDPDTAPVYHDPSTLESRSKRQGRILEFTVIAIALLAIASYVVYQKYKGDPGTVAMRPTAEDLQLAKDGKPEYSRSIVGQTAVDTADSRKDLQSGINDEKPLGLQDSSVGDVESEQKMAEPNIQVPAKEQEGVGNLPPGTSVEPESATDEPASEGVVSTHQQARSDVEPRPSPDDNARAPEKKREPVKMQVGLAGQAAAILEQRCGNCHGHKLVVDGLSVLRYDSLLNEEMEYVVAGSLEDSSLWERIAIDQDMPPEGQPPLSKTELSVLESWIVGGAPVFDAKPTRSKVPITQIWRAMYEDLRKLSPQQAAVTRYISFANLHNNSFVKRHGQFGANVDDKDISLAKAAVAKLLNSLSWEPRLTTPQVVGPDGLLMRVNLEDFGWSQQKHWSTIRKQYPYGMNFSTSSDAEQRKTWDEIIRWTGTELPMIRADWLTNALPRSPLYESLLGLPDTLGALERGLSVDADKNLIKGAVMRAGFTESGVSQHNRIVERHKGRWGSYWKSYDFGSSEGRANIFKFPLGPEFDGNPDSEYAFKHDGGEMIFSLPNGLQGYFLTDGNGLPLAVGPITVVRDLKETSGSPEIKNAVSCMACHKRGIIPFTDAVRSSRSIPFGESRLRVDQLYPDNAAWSAVIREDQLRFEDALNRVLSPYTEPTASETVFHTVRRYQRDMEIDDVASELGLAEVETLKLMINTNSRLRELGLGPLVNGSGIKRSTWDGQGGLVFKAVIVELEIAVPL
ncbi:hypothetical protein OAG82_02085 [Rubripirellula sp.]|nr:c-type cytochrome domain-containing protein [Rubripirellula sp.]MDB4621625.1 hypothetical protein [Rubripirellula sp.]